MIQTETTAYPAVQDSRVGTVELRSVRRSFDGATAVVDDLTLDVAAGEFVALVGPSGCGKTTILRIIAGLENPDCGQVFINGNDVTQRPARDRDLAMVFQDYALFPHLNVADNITFGFTLRAHRRRAGRRSTRKQRRELAASVAETLGLQQLLDRKPAQLSGGQRQRVALARAMVHEPSVFLMDEPLSSLDAQRRADMRVELIHLHRRLGTTFVFVTHDQIEAMTMATRLVVMADGRIQQSGTPEQIYNKPANKFVAEFIGTPRMNMLAAETISGTELPTFGGTELTIGFRPSHTHITPAGDASNATGSLATDGVVDIIETLGDRLLISIAVGTGTVVAEHPADSSRPQRGDHVTVTVDRHKLHYFARTGERLEDPR